MPTQLEGIRLPDLYNTTDYRDWLGNPINNNLVETTAAEYPNSKKDNISAHLYLNSKIKDAIGEEGFNNLPAMKLQEKFDWYNNNILNQQQEETTPETEMLQEESSISSNTVPTKGTMRDWFKNNAGGDYSAFLKAEQAKRQTGPQIEYRGLPGMEYKSEATQDIEEQLRRTKEETPNNIVGIRLLENKLNAAKEKDRQDTKNLISEYEEAAEANRLVTDDSSYYKPIRRELWDTSETNAKVDGLADRFKERLSTDSRYAFDVFKQFEDTMIKNIPQYRNYHDTDQMPFTPEEMQDIMAEYYSIRQLKDENEANAFAANMFQTRLAERQSIVDKTAVAIQQFGANYAGMWASTLGIAANTPFAIWDAISKDTDIEGLSGFKEFLYYAADNPLTKWGNLAQTTGTWVPELQKEYEELEFSRLALQADPNKKVDIKNVPFELYTQMAYTSAGMRTGTTIAQILSNTVGKETAVVASKLLAKEANGISRFAGNAINVLGKDLVIAGTSMLPAAAEASMDGLEKYNVIKNQAQESTLMGLEDQLAREREDGTFDRWYQENTRIPYTLPLERKMTDEEVQELASLREQERDYLWNVYTDLRVKQTLENPDVQAEIENIATRQGAKTLTDETLWITFGDALFTNVLGGKSFKELRRQRAVARSKPIAASKYDWVPEGNFYRAVPKQITSWDKVKAVAQGVGEAAEEGFEEYFQTMDSQMHEDIGKHLVASYIKGRYDPDSVGTVIDQRREIRDVAMQSLGRNFLSDEALYSFALGAVSTLLGTPTVFGGVRAYNNTLTKTGSFKEAIKEFGKNTWRSGIFENLQDLKVKQLQDEREAEDLNRWIAEHPEIANFNDEAAIVKFVDDQRKALNSGDEATYRDALMGQKVATMLMLSRANPNGAGANLYARLKEITKLSAGDSQARSLVDQILVSRGDTDIQRTTEGPLNEDEVAVLENVKEKAKDLLDTQKALMGQIRVLESQFGNSISAETRDALAYSLAMQDDWTKRIDSINEKAIQSYNSANPDRQVKPISSEEAEVKNAIARFGTLDNAQKEYNRLMAERRRIQSGKKHMYKYEYRAELRRNTREAKEAKDAMSALRKAGEDTIITPEEILSLSSKSRAYILDENNRSQYSEAQRKQIEAFEDSEGINGEILNDLKDAGRLQNRKEYYRQEYQDLIRNNGILAPIFDREVRREASKTWTRKKLGTALGATSYEEFKKSLDAALMTGEFTAADRATFSEIFNDKTNPNQDTSKYWQQYMKEELNRRTIRSIIQNSPEFQKLTEPQKQLVEKAIEQEQRAGNEINTKSIIARLSDPAYVEQLKKEGIDVSPLMDAETFEQMAAALDKVMEQKKNYDENVKVLNEMKQKRVKQEKEKASQVPETSKKEDTVIKKDRFEKEKDKNITIFKKVANVFRNKKAQKLTREEFISLMNLYSGEPITDSSLIGDINTSLTESNLQKIVDDVTKAIENKLYLDPAAAETEDVKNAIEFNAAIGGILETLKISREEAGINTSLNTFFKNSIVAVAPELTRDFSVEEEKLGKLNGFGTKVFESLSTNAEKEWYKKNDIDKNLAILSATGMANADYVFIKDSALIDKAQQELGLDSPDDDVMPIIVAARVPEGTENSIKADDGYSYLYVGLLQDSRAIPAVQERTQLNILRDKAINQDEDGPIKNDDKVFVNKGAVPKFKAQTEDKTETTSFRDWLLDKHKGDEKAALEDFAEHYRRVTVTNKDGNASFTFNWNGSSITRTFATTSKKSNWTTNVYLIENPNGTVTPLFLEVVPIDELPFDDEHSMYEALDELELYDEDKYGKEHAYDFVRDAITGVGNILYDESKVPLSKKGIRQQKITELNGTADKVGKLQKRLSKIFNFAEKSWEVPMVRVGVRIASKEGEEYLEFIAWENGESTSSTVFDIPNVLSTIPMSEIGDKAQMYRFIQEAIKNLIYDEDGNIRTMDSDDNGKEWPVIKYQDTHIKSDPDVRRAYDRKDVEHKFRGNIWRARSYKLDEVPVSITVNDTLQGGAKPQIPVGTEEARQIAIQRITADEFIDKNEGRHYELAPGETEVTTFIKSSGDSINWSDVSPVGRLATNLGSSIDKFYRVWRQLPEESRSVEGMKRYLISQGKNSWIGINGQEFGDMINQLKRIDKFFADRDEIQINADLIFKSNIIYEDSSIYLVGKPDIITVDRNGKYHIYDMKSFRNNSGAESTVNGFKNIGFTIPGLLNGADKVTGWRKQLSLYKAMIESKLGPGTVSEDLGIIPIRLGYDQTGQVLPDVDAFIGAHKIVDRDGKPFHISFKSTSNAREKAPDGTIEPVTRCFDDVIHMTAITKLTDINPERWKKATKLDEAKAELGEIKQQAADMKLGAPQAPTSMTLVNPTGVEITDGEPIITSPIDETDDDTLLAELGGLGDPFADPTVEEAITDGSCYNVGAPK